MKIRWINPVGTDGFDGVIGNILKSSAQAGTTVDVVSLPEGRPNHLEYHAYEGLVTADIPRLVYHLSPEYDGIVIVPGLIPVELAQEMGAAVGIGEEIGNKQ